jgi:hypothetical protein
MVQHVMAEHMVGRGVGDRQLVLEVGLDKRNVGAVHRRERIGGPASAVER